MARTSCRFHKRGGFADEIKTYQNGRYISTSEAVWRILRFDIHHRHPHVETLDVHLPNGQRVYFRPEHIQQQLENPRKSKLLAFFDLCSADDFAKTLLYDQVPSYYTWNASARQFKRRKVGSPVEGHPGIFKDSALGRVYTIHPSAEECYFLRLLLHTVRGPTSFEDLRRVEAQVHNTFKEACEARGLLEGDKSWDDALAEACVSNKAPMLRQLFAVMLVFCNLSKPKELWTKYKSHFAEDLLMQLRRRRHEPSEAEKQSQENRALRLLQEAVLSIGGRPLQEYDLPKPPESSENQDQGFDIEELRRIVEVDEPRLNEEQRAAYERIVTSVDAQDGGLFFLDAPGGTGKTHLIKLILAKVRSGGKIALAAASSGIAATLLPGGKTSHSLFKIPLDLYDDSHTCGISKESALAKELVDCVFIVWDECTMAHKKAVEAVSRTLKDIRNDNRPMGGVTFLFSGDFRQTLPVVVKGTRADQMHASIKKSNIWSAVQRLRLSRNMRAETGRDTRNAKGFSEILLQVGDGRLPFTGEDIISLPKGLCQVVSDRKVLIQRIYGDPRKMSKKPDSWFCERSILAPRNDQVAELNNKILLEFPGQEVVYSSVNTVLEVDAATEYPVEFLESLSASGIPAHEIHLKVGAPIMLLRNICPPKLCNGTRLRVSRLQKNVIEAVILTGCGMGEEVFIPRIPLIPNNFPFQFKRVQFPVSLCFAMTINKSQGQTFNTAGLDLKDHPCFSHGQFYVACSRVSSPTKLFVLCETDSTRNVVYREALL